MVYASGVGRLLYSGPCILRPPIYMIQQEKNGLAPNVEGGLKTEGYLYWKYRIFAATD